MLWDFGFRYHANLQTKWIDGAAGLGTIAKLSDAAPNSDPLNGQAEDFLSANNPELLEMIRNASEEDKQNLLEKLEKNFDEIRGLMEMLKDDM